MDWTPESVDERVEAALITAIAVGIREEGPENVRRVIDELLLRHQSEVLAAPEENPARRRLVRLLQARERGFE